ncbi:MAG: methyltransferase domain-containing protein [Oscillospiraceae bacterium]|nr:methyltransferase domain-containing protein [Oscillospiraceae bacterium]
MFEPIKNYYENYDEDGRLTSQHGSVEFLTTMRYIEKYLKSGGKILEIGAGTGRYSHALAKKGYSVDAVELAEHNIEIFKHNTDSGENITVTQGNAIYLRGFADNLYDVTLLLGPMYHLFTKEDKQKAISEAIRVTKPGGIIYAAYCISDVSILVSGFKRKSFSVAEFIEKGYIETQTFSARSDPSLVFEIVRKENIDDLMSTFSVTRLHYVAADGYAYHMREEINLMDTKEFDLYLQYHFATCERTDMVGLSAHTLDIYRKD